MIIGRECAALCFRPDIVLFLAQQSQKLGVIAGAAELYRIQAGNFIKAQKLVISLDAGLFAALRQDSRDDGGNAGGTVITQHADALVALFHIEVAQIFITGDGITDAGGTHMGDAQVGPLQGELTACLCQREKRSGKGGDSSGGAGTHNALGGDFHMTEQLRGSCGFRVDDLIQNGRVGGFACGKQFLLLTLSTVQRSQIFFFCFNEIHRKTSLPVARIISPIHHICFCLILQ